VFIFCLFCFTKNISWKNKSSIYCQKEQQTKKQQISVNIIFNKIVVVKAFTMNLLIISFGHCVKRNMKMKQTILVCYITKDARNGWVNTNDGIHERKFLTHSVIIMSWNWVRNQFRVKVFKKTSSNQKK